MDGSPVYNLNHAFGLLSVFNSTTLKHVNLFKGGIPARYGGRLSSVLDVSVREGNKKQMKGDFTLSTIAAGITAEGPIVKEKASFLFSVRRSWPDLLVTGIASQVQDGNVVPGLHFLDVNGKVNVTLWKKHQFYLSYYTGQDKLFLKSRDDDMKTNMDQGWGNHLGALRWNTMDNKGGFTEVSLHYSRFYEFEQYTFTQSDGKRNQLQTSGMQEYGVKASYQRPLNDKFRIQLGTEGFWRLFELPHKQYEEHEEISRYGGEEHTQLGAAGFVSVHYNSHPLVIELGVRSSVFGHQLFDHVSIEPRLSANYYLSNRFSFKAGAMYNVQPMYALTKTTNGFPGYTWIPLADSFKPQTGYQFSGGFHWQAGASLHFDVEGYFKRSQNLAGNYLHPSFLYSANQYRETIEQGEGQFYGCDVLAEYRGSSWNIRMGYSWSKGEVSFPSVNHGQWFPSDFDLRHDLSLTGSWHIYMKEKSKGWLTGNFALHSGTPVTLPSQAIESPVNQFIGKDTWFNAPSADYYNGPNNYRLKTYHRLDLGFHMERQKRRGTRTWSLGLINVYNRMNPYIIYRDEKAQFKQLVMFPIMPFVSFKRSF